MNHFENYAKPIVSYLPEAQRFDPPDSNEDNRLPERIRHENTEGQLISVTENDYEELGDVIPSDDNLPIEQPDFFGDMIIDRILDEQLNESDRDDITRGVWEEGIEALAFYKSYHFVGRKPYPGKWGIFIYAYGARAVADDIDRFYPGKHSPQQCALKALRFLHRHERFHWHMDAWTMSHEAIQRVPLYENYLNYYYRHLHPTFTFEEALANAHALTSLRREGVTDFMKYFMSQQPGAYARYQDNRMELRSRVATQILDGMKAGLSGLGRPCRPDQAPWVAQGSKSLLWDGNCPVYIISGVRPGMIIPPNVGAPAFRENREFVIRYLSGKPLTATDHEYYQIDNGERLKLPNEHGQVDRLKPWEFDNILKIAGMRLSEYREERMRTRMWKKNVPRAIAKPPMK